MKPEHMRQGKEQVKCMKSKSMIIAAVVMIPIVIIVSVLSVGYSRERGGKIHFVFGGKAQLRNTMEIPLSDIDSLQVSYTSDNLEIYPTEGDKVIIKEYLISDEKDALADVEITDRTAVITGGKDVTITIFGFFAGLERIELYIPRAGIAGLNLQTTSGNITAKDNFSLDAQKLEITASSGNIKWFDSKAEEIKVQAGSGNIGLEGISGNASVQAGSGNVKVMKGAGSFKIKTGSGNISIEQLTGQSTAEAGSGNITAEQLSGIIAMETGSGGITIRELSGEGSVKAGSGNVKVEASQVTGDIKAKTGSGGIRLNLPEELSFQMEIQTGSGNINTSFDDSLSYNKKGNQASGTVGGNPSCLISVEANSGNVHITAE